ncbi:MAG: SAM-dependent DNA methyltransferase [Burkholderiales bacterium]|nr:MAG: SAM-dependent DNA methyltransferase [Burkholderiales bacterium]
MGHTESAAALGLDGTDHTRELLRLIRTTAHRWSQHEVFADFVELSSLSFSNAVDPRQFDVREARYLEIAKKYPRDEFERFPRMLGHLTLAMEQCCVTGELTDVLGGVYMQLELGNERAGQFFTPYPVSRLIAAMLVGDGAEAREKGFIDLSEPACGAGGMVIAMADALQQAGLNYQSAMHATCIDIDPRCVHMTYLQLSLLHIPAVVLHGNALSLQVWSRWYTPAHVLGGWRRRLEERLEREAEAARGGDEPQGLQQPTATAPAPRSEAWPPSLAQLKLFED